MRRSRKRTKNRMPKEVVEAVRERANGACEAMVAGVCVGSVEQLHHRRLRSQGGAHTVENLIAACSPCHNRFHREVAEAVLHGWIVRSVNDPVDVPMMYRGALGFLTVGGGVVSV